jgi:hypothetical protein
MEDPQQLSEAIKHLAGHDALDLADVRAHPVISQNPELLQMAQNEVAASAKRKALREAARANVVKNVDGSTGFDPRPKTPLKPAVAPGIRPTPSKYRK